MKPLWGSPSLAEAILIQDNVSEEEEKKILKCFENVPPPKAESAAEVRRNCQTWCMMVLKYLRPVGIVEERKIDEVMARLEPVRGRTPVID